MRNNLHQARIMPRVNLSALALIALITAGCALRFWYMAEKIDFHIDEGFSAAITNYSRYPAKDQPIRDKWVSSEEIFARAFTDRLEAARVPDFGEIARVTGEDVHPPLYYWLLAIVRKIAAVQIFQAPAKFAFAGYTLNTVLFMLTALLLHFVAKRTSADARLSAAALALFCFSPAAASLTVFIRMYELLALACLLYFAAALAILNPRPREKGRRLMQAASYAGLGVAAFSGFMTQYYFLFCLAPVAAVSAAYLIREKRIRALGGAILATCLGILAALAVFPEAAVHLTSSYRATQSFEKTLTSSAGDKLWNMLAYFGMVRAYLVPSSVVLLAAAILLADRLKARKSALSGSQAPREDHGNELQKKRLPKAVVLALSVFAFTMVIIPVSAPYQTARYIGAFFPLYILAFAGLMMRFLPARTATALTGAAAIVLLARALLAHSPMEFHEDYRLEPDTSYMRSNESLIICTTQDAAWKNLMPYVNSIPGRNIYVTYPRNAADIGSILSKIARESDEETIIALVDEWFPKQPALERIGWYGFYHAYRVK